MLKALSGITDASSTNPYLIKIEPGIYALGTKTLVMKSYVDIEGSGEDITRITASGNDTLTIGTVRGANNVELRFLTVENTGGYYYAKGISNVFVSPRITHVSVIAQGGILNCGIYNHDSSPKISNVIATAQGGT